MSVTSVIYQSLQTDDLVSVTMNYSVLRENFTIINEFIKSFGQFQKKFVEVEKSQRTLTENFATFKDSTQSQFLTINQILESRTQISQGKSSSANEELNEIKKSIKELKSFVTQTTREEEKAQQVRSKQQQNLNKKLQKQLKQLQLTYLTTSNSASQTIETLKEKISNLQLQTVKRTHISQMKFEIQTQQLYINSVKDSIKEIDKLLVNTKVQQFKQIIDEVTERTTRELNEMRLKISNRACVSDLLKLEEMILNVMEFGFAEVVKNLSNKNETKKALLFLQKRINSLIVMMLGSDQQQREGLLTAKQIKCISCSKDLGEVEGKLDKVKNWSVFPVKQSLVKQKYAGFGAGFQTIVESTIVKKGGEVKYDQKGRMIEPFNLTGTMQGSLMRSCRSQHKLQHSESRSKIGNQSPSKSSLKYETSFMHQFGKESGKEIDIRIIEEYYNRFRGLESFVMGNKKSQEKK